jgi:hypothetical protein
VYLLVCYINIKNILGLDFIFVVDTSITVKSRESSIHVFEEGLEIELRSSFFFKLQLTIY